MPTSHKNDNKTLEKNTNISKKHKVQRPNIDWKNMRSNIMGALGKLSKSFLLPIALLPIAGLFIGIGAAITSSIGDHSSVGYQIGDLFNQMGSVCFNNLPILFCISSVIAFTDDAGAAALAGIVAFLVFNAIIASLTHVNDYFWTYSISINGGDDQVFSINKDIFNNFVDSKAGTAGWWDNATNQSFLTPTQICDIYNYTNSTSYIPSNFVIHGANETNIAYNLLFWHNISSALFVNILGLNSLNTGVFAGIIVGCIVAYIYNRTYKVQLPTVINFFSGIKFVPIVMFFAVIPLSLLFILIWPPIGNALSWFGENTGKIPYGFDSFIFELIERSLVPFGLHHVFYAPLWWTSAGGGPLSSVFSQYSTSALAAAGITLSDLLPATLSASGDQYMLYAILGDPNISFHSLHLLSQELTTSGGHINIDNLGRFQSGKFPFMMFGLPAAALAMWASVPKENRAATLGIYFSAGITSFLTGITEPIEYTFLFVAPWLFYGIHVPLAAISFWAMGFLKVHVGQTVSGGAIDLTIFGIVPYNEGTRFEWILIVGPLFAPVYFFIFYSLIVSKDVKIPGRDGATQETSLYTKANYKAKKTKSSAEEAKIAKAQIIYDALGGMSNITTVDACASRLRVNVKDLTIVKRDVIKNQGATAVLNQGKQIQAIFGGEADVIKSYIKDIIKKEKRNQVSTADANLGNMKK